MLLKYLVFAKYSDGSRSAWLTMLINNEKQVINVDITLKQADKIKKHFRKDGEAKEGDTVYTYYNADTSVPMAMEETIPFA
jgi:hypothetical protein